MKSMFQVITSISVDAASGGTASVFCESGRQMPEVRAGQKAVAGLS